MPRLEVLFPAILALAACGKGGSARLEGHWRGSFVEGVPLEAQAAAMQFAKGMEIEIKGDAITVTTAQDKQSGHYTIDVEDKVSITIHTDRDGVADKQTFLFMGDKIFKWTVAEGRPAMITFVRD